MISTRRWVLFARSALATAAIVAVVAPVPSEAQEDSPGGEQARPDSGGQLDIELDVLRVEHTQVEDALGSLAENVAAQQTALDAANAAVMQAQADLDAANGAVAAAQQQLDNLSTLTDMVVVESYVNPPVESGIEALSAESLSDASIKQSILNNQANSNAALLDQFEAAQERVAAEQEVREQAASQAARRQSDAEAALGNLESALSQQMRFVLEVERRLNQRLSEAQALADIDPRLAEQILAREAQLAGIVSSIQEEARAEHARELAAELAAQAEESRSSGIQDPPGGVTSVTCTTGGTFTIAGDISGGVQQLLDDAGADGLPLCGYGYRDPAEQIALRRTNCGSSDYAIYEAPASYCSPPTAVPGRSLHEQGLAIDFTCGGGGTVGYGDACYDWLQSNSEEYGLYNLPGEPWHYSVNGD